MAVKCFKDLIVWQKSVDLAATTYEHTKQFPRDEIYGLRQQIRRAAISIASNIAEGQCRSTTRDFLHFLAIAQGSLAELETQVIIAERLAFFNAEQTRDLFGRMSEVGKLLSGLRNSLAADHKPV